MHPESKQKTMTKSTSLSLVAILLLATSSTIIAFSSPCTQQTSLVAKSLPPQPNVSSPPRASRVCITKLSAASSVASSSGDDSSSSSSSTEESNNKALTKQQKRIQQIRKEGGLFAFNTKYGALNPYAIYYGLVSIGLGLVWFVFLTLSQLFYKITGGRFDKKRRLPVFFSHVWGTLLMLFTGCFPKIENWDIIGEFHKR